MKHLRYGTAAWARYVADRRQEGGSDGAVTRAAAAIVDDVRRHGDAALVRLTERYDGVRLGPDELRVPADEVRRLAARAPAHVRRALREMAVRLRAFHRRQCGRGFTVRLGGGAQADEVVAPIDSAALYVPGGAGAYPSSVLMSAIPARLAGVPRLQVMTPPRTLRESAAVAAALVEAGLEADVFRVGGAQAVAACAYGTGTVPAVAKVVGPGNAYVAAAKRLVRGVVEVDTDAGPSEVVVLADDSADPRWVAADLLAQAEHGSGDEAAVLVTPSARLASAVAAHVRRGAAQAANAPSTRRALALRGAIVRVADLDEGVAAVNELAAEHAQVMARGADALAGRVVAGAVFVGPWTPAAVGDYGIGPNHVLPTGGAARFASALSVRDFQRRYSRVRLTAAALRRVGAGMQQVALAEGFPGHARSIAMRMERRAPRARPS
jgi:histidinol dehydrogenase